MFRKSPIRFEIFKFYIDALKKPAGLRDLDKLWTTLIASSNDEMRSQVITNLLEIPVINNKSVAAITEHIEPFEYLEKLKITEAVKIPKAVINELIKQARELNSLRHRAATRLIFLYRNNLLDPKSVDKLFLILFTLNLCQIY